MITSANAAEHLPKVNGKEVAIRMHWQAYHKGTAAPWKRPHSAFLDSPGPKRPKKRAESAQAILAALRNEIP